MPLLIRQGLWVCGILAALGGAILWQLRPILILAGQDPRLADLAGDYMDLYLWTLFPMLTTFGFSMAFAALGRAGTAALIIWLEVALNAVLDYLLVFGKFGFPALGMAGAGLASIIAYGVGHLIFFWALGFHRFFGSATLYLKAWQSRWPILKRYLALGLPKSFEILMRTALYSGFALLSGRIGTSALVLYTIVFETVLVICQMVGAVGIAGGTRTGMAYAGKNHLAIRQALSGTLLIQLLFLLPVMTVFLVFPHWIAMLFLGFGSPAAQALTPAIAPVLGWAALFVLVEGLRVVMVQVLNSFSDMKLPSLMAVLVYWTVSFPLGALLGFGAGLEVSGFWIGLTSGMLLLAIFYGMRFWWSMSDR